MSIDELMAILAAAREELGGDAQVVRYDYGSTDGLSVVRVSGICVETTAIHELGNGVAGWTLDEDRPGARVTSLLLD